jgi:transcriptional regulator with XRE-family HTH domain
MLKRSGRSRDSQEGELTLLVGERLRQLREQAKLSLEHLSRLAHVSRGMLSQIELGRSVPTVTVLSRIAAAFELPLSVFLTRVDEHGVQIMKRGETDLLRSADERFVSRALFPFRGARKAEFYELRLAAGCDHRSEAHASGTTENLVVASGAMAVVVDGTLHPLSLEDAIHFAADVPHSYVNRGPEPAVAYLVVNYPQSVTY